MNEFIPISNPYIAKNQSKYVNDCLKTNWISSIGPYIKKFQNDFSEFIGSKYGISTSNGTTALHLALAALDIGKGDEVIVPDLTFVASANAVAYTGAKPVFVDVNEKDWCIDPNLIEEKITKKTKAIMPVHLYGNSCDMDKIMKIAKKHSLFVIEDAAEATGAEYKNKKVGSVGDMGCFSFYGNKIITTGEGGMCTTNDSKLKDKMELLKDHGMSKTKKYFHPMLWFNYRMTNIQAAIGLAQLEEIDFILKQRESISKKYTAMLKPLKGIKLPIPNKNSKSMCWLFSLLINNNFSVGRDGMIERLSKKGIDSRPFFLPMHNMPHYKENSAYPVSELAARNGINLPTFTGLKDSQIEIICKAISATE